MRNLLIFLLFCSCLFISGCCDDCDPEPPFCIDDYSINFTDADLGFVSFTLPNGESYAGTGVLPIEISFDNYTGIYQAINITEVIDSELHTLTTETLAYFEDDDGNSIWWLDDIFFVNIGVPGQADAQWSSHVVDGRGDFECVNGHFSSTAFADFIAQKIDVNTIGILCRGCD